MSEMSINIKVIEIEGRIWFLLKEFGDSWDMRAFSIDRHPRQVKEPNDHRAFQIGAKGSVKCSPKKEWDYDKFIERK